MTHCSGPKSNSKVSSSVILCWPNGFSFPTVRQVDFLQWESICLFGEAERWTNMPLLQPQGNGPNVVHHLNIQNNHPDDLWHTCSQQPSDDPLTKQPPFLKRIFIIIIIIIINIIIKLFMYQRFVGCFYLRCVSKLAWSSAAVVRA